MERHEKILKADNKKESIIKINKSTQTNDNGNTNYSKNKNYDIFFNSVKIVINNSNVNSYDSNLL